MTAAGKIELGLVAALTRHRVLGHRGALPWHLPEDLRLFRRLTWGHSVIMGRRTFDAIGHPLPGRRNIVLSRTLEALPGVLVCRSLDQALAAATADRGRAFVIGGAEIYRQALPLADTMELSWVRGDFPGDTFFPPFDPRRWQVAAASEHLGFRHVRYRRSR